MTGARYCTSVHLAPILQNINTQKHAEPNQIGCDRRHLFRTMVGSHWGSHDGTSHARLDSGGAVVPHNRHTNTLTRNTNTQTHRHTDTQTHTHIVSSAWIPAGNPTVNTVTGQAPNNLGATSYFTTFMISTYHVAIFIPPTCPPKAYGIEAASLTPQLLVSST